MTQFEAVVEYAGKRVKVKSDSFEELHATLAGIEELNRDADFLTEEKGISDVIPVYRKDGDENEYFGLQDRRSRKNVTYGKKRGESMIPFFPKGADGYYDPDAGGPRGGSRPAPHRSENGQSESRSSGKEPRTNGREQRGDRRERAQQRQAQQRSAERQHTARRREQTRQAPASSDDLPF